MSSYQTGEVKKNYKMFANPVFMTPGIYIYIIYIYIYIYKEIKLKHKLITFTKSAT